MTSPWPIPSSRLVKWQQNLVDEFKNDGFELSSSVRRRFDQYYLKILLSRNEREFFFVMEYRVTRNVGMDYYELRDTSESCALVARNEFNGPIPDRRSIINFIRPFFGISVPENPQPSSPVSESPQSLSVSKLQIYELIVDILIMIRQGGDSKVDQSLLQMLKDIRAHLKEK